ncbi:GEVED domain-containing protein [Dokdonella sp.]|uniref:DUF6923 family protein n=1 Tax=Dokdonella sp. TaxID=2291710 RepID=UPI0026069B34|nr:GEVED domain-containing protein [Dokdonella sp.]
MKRAILERHSSTSTRASRDAVISRALRLGRFLGRRLFLLAVAAWSTAAFAQVPPAFSGCDTRAFLFQGAPTNVIAIDLVTGVPTTVGSSITATNLNAVAYNPLDNYIYGVSATTGATLGHIFRVGSNFAVQDLGLPIGLPAAGYNIGEFDANGHLWIMVGTASTTVYDIDLKPGSSTYMRVVNTRPLTTAATYSGGADWAYDRVDGFLYRTPLNTTTNRLHLLRYNRANGVQTDLGAIAGLPARANLLIGANYADSGGFIYASDNTSGEIFRINPVGNSGSLFSTGPASGTNDGARCFNAPVPVDFGDAPDSYGTLLASSGARHSIPGYNEAAKTATLMLGSRISADSDGQPDANAALDTYDDGLDPTSLVLTTGATTASAVVAAINAKATPATIAGWIDFNKNGQFDAGERAQATVPANTTTATPFTLTWSGIASIPAGFSSFARFRIASNAAQVTTPTGAASDGEVEDYVVPIKQPVGCTTSPSVFNTAINATGNGVLAAGSRDRNWEVGLGTAAGGPASVPTWIQAYVTGNAAPGAWANSPFGNADWTSYFANANQGANDVDEYHRYRFTLDGAVDPGTFALGIDFYADNSVWEVYVNGQAQSGLIAGLPQSPANPYYYGGFTAANRAQLLLNRSWRTGPNEIVVKVRSAPGFVGFLAQVTSTSLCPVQVGIDKSADPPGALTPNGTVVYTVTATNTGAVAAPNTVVSDPLPNGIVSGTWTCAAASGAVCPSASGTMPLSQTIATFPGGGVVTYTITGQVGATPPPSVTNTASAVPPAGGTCYPGNAAAPCTASVSNPPVPVVAVTKSSGAVQAVPGSTLTYVIHVKNIGAVAADGATIDDPIPAGLGNASWSCTSSGGAVCPNASGSGAIAETIAIFPAGGELVYTVTATVDANPPAAVANTVTVVPPDGGICGDGSAPPCEGTVTLPAAPQVRVVKSATPAGAVAPGGTVTYTVVVTNEGNVAAPNTRVQDAFPPGISSASWTCVASTGAACPNATSGGAVAPPDELLDETIATLPPGGSVTYTIAATVAANPPAHIVNTVAVTPPGGVCLPGNTLPPCTSSVDNTPTDARITIVKVPTALDGTPFAFTTTVPAPDDAFTLSSGTTLTRTFTAAPGTVSITEAVHAGWVLIDVACANAAGTATFTYTGATTSPTNGFERGDDTANVTVGYGDQVTCTYTNAPTALPTLAKYFNTDPPGDPPPPRPVIPRSGTALLTFVVSNRAPSATAQGGLAFTDTLPPGLVLANGTTPPSALVGANTCGGTITAAAGTNAISLAGGSVPAGADCRFTVRVAAAP